MKSLSSRLAFLPIVAVLILIGCSSLAPRPAHSNLRIAPGIEIALPPPWTVAGSEYANGVEIVYKSDAKYAMGHEARILVLVEQRIDVRDARKRLVSIARSRGVVPKVFDIDGWPAVEIRFRETLPRKGVKDLGGEGATISGNLVPVPRARIGVAFDQRIVLFDVWLAPDADNGLLERAVGLARTASLPYALEPDALAKALDELRKSISNAPPPTDPPGGQPMPAQVDLNATPLPPSSPGLASGELEVVSNASGSQIIVATNSSLVFSSTGGAAFAPGTTGLFGLNDPTLARGASGAFYLGGIAFPTAISLPATAPPFTGCANSISVSSPASGGAVFNTVGFSARCPTAGSICLPDQPHIGADSVNASPGGQDQLYAVWRNFTPTPCIACPPTCNSLVTSPAWQTSMLSCSQNAGLTWTNPAFALPGDHPRVSVGSDGKVYVVTLDGNTVKLLRFSSCSRGLVPDPGFPVDVADGLDIACPLPGIDRCDTPLSSQTAAPDPANAAHLFVTYSRRVGAGNLVVAKESLDAGRTFGGELLLSGSNNAPRFMPWSCSTLGSVFAGWYDRSAASVAANDLTDYFVGSPVFPAPLNLTTAPDPQCASGWPVRPRQTSDAESCSTQPQLAGRCQNGALTGSNTPCDFSDGGCPSGESCTTGGGQPKYGDYNGFACANNSVIAAWTSATAPPGLPVPAGLSLFTRVIPLSVVVPSWDQLRFDVTTGADDARGSTEIIASVTGQGTFCLKPSTGRAADASCPSNGGGATDQTGRSSWQFSDGVISQTFTVPAPQTSASGFAGLTLSTLQGSCFGCTSDNWNVENLTVTAIDSTGALPPTVLLNLTSGSGVVNSTSCVMRLKESPNASTASMSLVSPPTNVRTYVGGPSGGSTTSCTNNGG